MGKRAKELIKFLLFVVVLYIVLKFFLLPTINSPGFGEFTQSIGVWGYLVVIGYVIFSHVFAPIAGTPGVALGITVYGINTGAWLLHVGSLISASINFLFPNVLGENG